MFGYGMILAGGCPQRCLVKAGSGNLKALATLVLDFGAANPLGTAGARSPATIVASVVVPPCEPPMTPTRAPSSSRSASAGSKPGRSRR